MKISRILSGISIFTHFEDADSAFQNCRRSSWCIKRKGLAPSLKTLQFLLLHRKIYYFFETGIQISLLKDGDVTSLCSFHRISGPSICS